MIEESSSLPKPTDPTLDDRFLARCIADESTLPERRALERWLSAHPEWRASLSMMMRDGELRRAGWDCTADAAQAGETILARVGLVDAEVRQKDLPAALAQHAERRHADARRRGFGWISNKQWEGRSSRAVAVRTAIVGAVMVALIAIVHGVRAPSSASAHLKEHAYTTTSRQRASVVLNDGTRVTLGPSTTLRVAAGFGDAARTVILDGQGYFDVAQTSGAPFVVRAGRTVTRVLGTRFDVQHYPEDTATRVVVASGKVELRAAHGDRAVTLTSGTMGRATDSTVTRTAVSDLMSYTAWTDGRLVFRDAPVPEVLSALTRWYGYEFRLTDTTLLHRNVTAAFRLGENAEMLRVVRYMLSVTVTVRDSVVTLRPTRNVDAQTPAERGRWHNEFKHTTEVGR